jgi:hypothetical protein
VFIPNARRLSRRRFVSLAASGAAGLVVRQTGLAATTDISIKAPYFHQGSTGSESAVNCGPTAVCMAINYSGAAYPAVANVRATLGVSGPTDVDQWGWLLDVYGVPWYPTWSQEQVAASLRKGHPVVIGTWMGTLSAAGDYEVAYAEKGAWQGRYDSFSEGHAMVIVGLADDGLSYLVHDPNVFPGDATGYYSDGTPKGQYRRYSVNEITWNMASQGDSMGLAIVPYAQSLAPAQRVKRVDPARDGIYEGPGGGNEPRRGIDQLNPETNDED